MSDDRDLEDFFARKAKKKTKEKGKAFTTSTKIAQNVEQLQHAEREREQAHLQPAPEKPAVPNAEDEQWNDFQEEVVRDLTGLKIVELKKSSSHVEQPEGVGEQDSVEDDVPLVKSESSKTAGPWQVVGPSPTVPSTVESVKPATVTSQDSATEQPAKYRPGAFHAQRNQQSSASRLSQTSWKARRKAPDVNSEEAFPSLHQAASASQPSVDTPSEGFRSVKYGMRPPDCSESRPQLELENKFGPLSNSN